MKIWHLERKEDDAAIEEAINFVIVAPSPVKAREMAAKDQRRDQTTWYSPHFSTCKAIGEAHPSLKKPWIVASTTMG